MNLFFLSFLLLAKQASKWWKIVMTLNIWNFQNIKREEREWRKKTRTFDWNRKCFRLAAILCQVKTNPKQFQASNIQHITKIDYTFDQFSVPWSYTSQMGFFFSLSLLRSSLCVFISLWSCLANGCFVSIISFQLTHCSYCYTIVSVECDWIVYSKAFTTIKMSKAIYANVKRQQTREPRVWRWCTQMVPFSFILVWCFTVCCVCMFPFMCSVTAWILKPQELVCIFFLFAVAFWRKEMKKWQRRNTKTKRHFFFHSWNTHFFSV